MTATGFAKHDHSQCISLGTAAAEEYCRDAGLRLTEQRRRVLEILLKEHRALGAYEILDVLRAEGHNAQPPVAYRALDFLVQHGFAHKVERLNAFIACAHPGETHAPAFLVCRKCKAVAETPIATLKSELADTAQNAGFAVDEMVIEAIGVCPSCMAERA